MHIAFLHSSLDPAGRNLAGRMEKLLAERDDWPLCRAATLSFHTSEGRLIHAEGVDRGLGADIVVFLSRHSSSHPVPALTVHVTGNFGAPAFGGEARTLAPAAPAMMHAVLRGLASHAPPGYRASYEATHHGPTGLGTPSLFVEIGSTEKEWTDPVAADAAARAVLEAVPGDVVPLVGFGGTHYAVRQTEIALSSKGAFGHIVPSRQVPELDDALVAEMIRQTGAVAAYLDKKALAKADAARLQKIFAETGLPVLTEGEITGIGDLSWEAYTAVRSAAEEISPGGRVQTGTLSGSGEPVETRLPATLVAEADRADQKAFREALALAPAASVAGERGEILPTFITFANHRDEIIHYLISLCIRIIGDRWNTATEGDYLVVTKTRFDPAKAGLLGVPKGPLFGRLSSGQSVEVGGVVITPAMVSSCSETRIHIPGLERYINEVHS